MKLDLARTGLHVILPSQWTPEIIDYVFTPRTDDTVDGDTLSLPELPVFTEKDIRFRLGLPQPRSDVRHQLKNLYASGILHRFLHPGARSPLYDYQAKGDLEWLMKYVSKRFFNWFRDTWRESIDSLSENSDNDE